MKKVLLLSAFLMSAMLIIDPGFIQAQSDATPKKYENPEWKNVVLIDYKPGKSGRAREIIQEYFIKANEMSGVSGPSLVVELETGGWDTMAVWDMKDGIESMNWDVSPDNIKWQKALNEIAGGAEKARAIQEEYSSCVAHTENHLGRKR